MLAMPARIDARMNPKIFDYVARWARFPGFSLLFDNPALNCLNTENGPRLHFQPEQDERERLFSSVAAWAAEVLDAECFWRYGVCVTPPSSYHVTAWDGLNVAVLEQCDSATRTALQQLIETLPRKADAEALFMAQLAPVIADLNALLPIRFRPRGLRSTPGIGLVVDLQAENAEAEERLQAFQQCRREHAGHLASRWGIAYLNPLAPHLTVAYYANPSHLSDADAAIQAQLPSWQAKLLSKVDGLSVEFAQLNCYMFTSMEHFYPRRWGE